MWAITTFGIGHPVTARAIMPEWELVEGESLKVEHWEEGMVLDADGVTVRPLNSQEVEKASVQSEIDALKSTMAAIEAEQYMIRGAREAWLVLMENTAAGQGVTQEQLYAANPFYKKIKDADTEIAAMRDQINALEAQL